MAGFSSPFVDLTVTSPPYDDMRTYTEQVEWNWDAFTAVADGLEKVTKPGGVIVWVVGDRTINGSESGSSFRQALYFQEIGFRLHDTMIWRKSNFSSPEKVRYHQTFEYMFVFSKGAPKTFNPIKDRANVCSGKVGSFGSNTVTQRDGGKKVRPRKTNTAFGARHNVWDLKTAGQTQESKRWKHPAMFPLELPIDHILSWSNEGDVVFDPFLGSGTTAVAAARTKRLFVGCEIAEEYFDIAIKRVSLEEENT